MEETMKKLMSIALGLIALSSHAVEADFKKLVDHHMVFLNETYVTNSIKPEFADQLKMTPFGVYTELLQDGRTFYATVDKKRHICVELPVSIHRAFHSIGYISVSCEPPQGYLSIILDAYEFKRGRFVVVRSNVWEATPSRRIASSLFSTSPQRVCSNQSRARRTMCSLGFTMAMPNVSFTGSINTEARPDQVSLGVSTSVFTYQKDQSIAVNRRGVMQGANAEKALNLTKYQKSACHISRRICKLALP